MIHKNALSIHLKGHFYGQGRYFDMEFTAHRFNNSLTLVKSSLSIFVSYALLIISC